MTRISQLGATSPLEYLQTSTDSNLETLVGARFVTSDGRELVLVQNGGNAIAAGLLCQAPAIIANHQNCATTAFQAASANGNVPATVTVTLGATAVTANQYAGGYVNANDGTGEGQLLRIASHPAADASAAVVITLEDNPAVALVGATTEVSLIPNPYNGVIVNPTTFTNAPAGANPTALAASAYGFLVTRGPVSLLGDATAPVVGTAVAASAATAGAVGDVPYATDVLTGSVIGNAIQTAVSTEYRMVFINL